MIDHDIFMSWISSWGYRIGLVCVYVCVCLSVIHWSVFVSSRDGKKTLGRRNFIWTTRVAGRASTLRRFHFFVITFHNFFLLMLILVGSLCSIKWCITIKELWSTYDQLWSTLINHDRRDLFGVYALRGYQLTIQENWRTKQTYKEWIDHDYMPF